MTLQQLAGEFEALDALLDESGGEITEANEAAIDAFLKEMEANVAEKADSYCEYLAWLKARVAVLKEREENIKKDRNANENKMERLRERLKEFGVSNGLLTCSTEIEGTKKKEPGKKIETKSGWVISVQKSGGKRALTVDETFPDVPEEYLIYKAPEIDREKVRAALVAGVVLPFAKLEEQGTTLVIK